MVLAGETTLDSELDRVISTVLADSNLPVLTICGPSCSGKTTLCNRLTDALTSQGRQAKLVSIDDYFRDREELNREASDFGGEIDYDSIEALDLAALEQSVRELSERGRTEIPHYNLHSGKRDGCRELTWEKGDLIIFEGIQTLYPEFVAMLDRIEHLAVYTSVENGYRAGGHRFSPREIRFIRRIVRDFRFRNAPPQFTYYLWKSVGENEEKNIFPNAPKADLTVNTALGYELSAVKNDLLNVLSRIPEGSSYSKHGRELAAKFDKIESIRTDYIPENSIFREFIGK